MSITDKAATASANNVTIAENEQKVYEAGVKSEYDKFWDKYQNNGNGMFWGTAGFKGYEWSDAIFLPKYDIFPPSGDTRAFFQYCTCKNLRESIDGRGLKVNLTKCTTLNMWFRDTVTTELPDMDTSNITIFTELVYNNSKLHTIPRLNVSKATYFNNTFTKASNLQNITFEGTISASISFKDCSLLTLESLKSVIIALVDYTGTTDKEFTCTLTLNSNSITLLETEGTTAEYTDSEGNVTTGLTWLQLIDYKKWNYA